MAHKCRTIEKSVKVERNPIGISMTNIFVYLLTFHGFVDCMDDRGGSRISKIANFSKDEECPKDLGYRLPNDTIPKKYVIAISLDLRKNLFNGAIQITYEIINTRDYVAMHAKDLDVESTTVCRQTSDESCVPRSLKSVHHVDKLEMIVVRASKIMEPGIYTITMNFSGSMDNRINGLYTSTYHLSNGNCVARKLAVTQFEPTYARKAFPCFDEPTFKSTFDIRIIYPSNPGYHVMSNMPCLSSGKSRENENLSISNFATSLPMPTYLVAFIVSDYSCTTSIIDSLTGTSIPVSVCTTSANKNKILFALNVATRALSFYINFFQIDYPLPKIDLVGVPDFAAGAMENWGLVTFRETEILHSADHSSVGNIRSVALTIAHELAHMWFGNLVTPHWWNDLWLNEGFATYMEHVAVNYIFPDWRQMDSFPLETKYLTMRSDSKITAHPIIRRSRDSDDIGQMFDHISYQKGAAILNMLEDAMGSTNFIHGIRKYLEIYKFGNADTHRLVEILQKQYNSEINLIDFIDGWTKIPGFPVVRISRTATGYELAQRRFFTRGIINENFTWTLPIRYVTNRKNDGIQLVWFIANATCAKLIVEDEIDWIKLNHRSIGYYIVNYDEDMWRHFENLLCNDIEVLDPLDRADLLHDSFFLVDSGDLDYTIALNFTRYLIEETKLQPWVVAASWLLRVDRLLAGTQFHRRFRYYARYLIGNVYRKIGWDPGDVETFDKRELRILVLRVACSLGHRDCLRVGEKLLKTFINSNGTIRPNPDLRSITYSFGLIRPGPDNLRSYEAMWQLFVDENDPQEKERLLIGLADVKEPDIIVRYLERVANESLVRRQNYFEAVGKVASNPKGLKIVWKFLRTNWKVLVKKYTLNDAAMGSLVGKIVSSFKNPRRLEEAKEFFANNPDAGTGENSRRLAIEESSSNIEWLCQKPRIIDRWLRINGFGIDNENNVKNVSCVR